MMIRLLAFVLIADRSDHNGK